MGRRAKKAPVQTKKRVKLDKRFKCPFCANDQVVECKMDAKAGVGSLACRLCGAAYQMPIHHLHEPIDVFSEWLDDCEAAANPNSNHNSNGNSNSAEGGGVPRYQEDDDEDDDDDELAAGSGLHRKSSPKKSSSLNHSIGLGDDDSDDE